MTSDLNPGATTEEIQALESQIGSPLPDSLRASLRLHNGEDPDQPGRVFANYGTYLSTTRILDEWTSRRKFADESDANPTELKRLGIISIEGSVKPEMFMTSWILPC